MNLSADEWNRKYPVGVIVQPRGWKTTHATASLATEWTEIWPDEGAPFGARVMLDNGFPMAIDGIEGVLMSPNVSSSPTAGESETRLKVNQP